ncbi:hypothetical protein LEMA_P002100.1 [Plenodomus lingam JN3]|uniref:C2 domain-containing protein n=1 Tax=Leptosphaeria maculans (strain JN3 / isolate v23.1.3 / race Av1-4-5-6-7-8) TaxID=985895 RepID=E5ADY4_LEPMJ|nr:hypothetical protein LEMA_P002100.1 [Plenodomus lingam JN3]CBY01423.1 hypothetical protein LEMA_P002100.1 [Plenodomus lingam JN3]
MATKAINLATFGNVGHTAGIFSDMTVDGPVIGTLVVIMDRARNLPNKRTMGKQDPYAAARLGKEAKKTKTDKRGGQTPRWDQELRFTVHDSPDYHRLKVSVFNDDKKTELIGETWVNLEAVITPGGGTSDDWHGLNCKGKYAGEVRIEFTYYDSRPKSESAPPEKKRESARPEGKGAAVGGPRESTPIKRRPLPSDPTGASPSPSSTPEHRGLKGIRAGPRELGSPRHQREPEQSATHRTQSDTPTRRPVPDTSSHNGTPTTNGHTPQRPQMPQEVYSTPPNPRTSNPRLPLTRADESFDMSYAAPKPYEVKATDTLPQHVRETGHSRTRSSQEDFRSSRGSQQPLRVEPPHSYSAPLVPTQHTYEPEPQQQPQQDLYNYPNNSVVSARSPVYANDQYQDPAYQVAPLRTSRSREQDQYTNYDHYSQPRLIEAPVHHDEGSHRRRSAMQPMVEDEDGGDLPPPPPMHRPGANTLPNPVQQQPSPRYHEDAPAPLSYRHREEQSQIEYELQPQPYQSNGYSQQQQHQPSERRYTYPRMPAQPASRPDSRDDMAPSPLRQETAALPMSLVPGLSAPRRESLVPAYEPPPSYETPPRLRHYSEPAEYRAITQYEDASHSQQLVHHQSFTSAYDYPHDPPEQPRQRSPVYEPAPLFKPRATSPGISPRHSPNPLTEHSSRGPVRSMPTRKSVSPRPPPTNDYPEERRLSSVAFNPDSFDVYNPRVSRSPIPSPIPSDDERPGSRMEYNEKGQIVTFSGRVVDASDHLPIDNWAPEPVPKGTVKEKAPRSRAQLNGSRDLEAARQREERYQKEREERERLRHAASQNFDTSSALVTSRHDFNASVNAGALVLAGSRPRDDYHSAPTSSTRTRIPTRPQPNNYDSSPHQYQHPYSTSPQPDSHILRERQNPPPPSYSSSPSYRGGRGYAAPPISAKIPPRISPVARR